MPEARVCLCTSRITATAAATLDSTSLLPRQTLDETWSTATAARRCLLEAINDVAQVNGPIGLTLLIGPPLNAVLLNRLILEGAQKRVYLLVYLVILILADPLNWAVMGTFDGDKGV